MANISKAAREDREQKERDEILKRSDEEYLEIEQFKEYEFSWCIAFEMAKRDPAVVKDVNRFVQFYKKNKQRIEFVPFSMETFETAYEYRIHRKAKGFFELAYDYFSQKHWLAPSDLYFISMDEAARDMANIYAEQFHHIQEQVPNERFTLEDEEGVMFKSSVNFNNDHFFNNKDSVTDEEVLQAIEDYDIDPTAIESQRGVSERFARPRLSIPDIVDKSTNVNLNLALPDNELFAYISHIKKKYDERKDVLKSSIELLGVGLDAMGFEEIDGTDVYKKDRRKTLPEKCADLFFIYDCYSSNLSMDYTLDKLNYYWNDERNAFPEQFQQKTYKRYLKLAKDFIENRKYQSLLIGQ